MATSLASMGSRWPTRTCSTGAFTHILRAVKDVTVQRQLGEYVLTVRKAKEDNIWINVALAIMTLISTTVVGSMLYGVDIFKDPFLIYMGIPFALAIMTVLGSHELGHYIVSKKNGIDATLPYFIPFP